MKSTSEIEKISATEPIEPSSGLEQYGQLLPDVLRLAGGTSPDGRLVPGSLLSSQQNEILRTMGSNDLLVNMVERMEEALQNNQDPSLEIKACIQQATYFLTAELIGVDVDTEDRNWANKTRMYAVGSDYTGSFGMRTAQLGELLLNRSFATSVLGDALLQDPQLVHVRQCLDLPPGETRTVSVNQNTFGARAQQEDYTVVSQAVQELHNFLDEHPDVDALLAKKILWLPNPDGVAFQWGQVPEELYLEGYDDYMKATRGAHLGKQTAGGDIPIIHDGVVSNISIEPTRADEKIAHVMLAQEQDEALTLTETTLETPLRPTFKISVTEDLNGKSEKYELWRATVPQQDGSVRQMILIQCSGAQMPTMYDENVMASYRGSVTRKPVIYLYPTKQMDVTVRLDYKGRLTNTYPQITNDTWQVNANPDGTLAVNGKKYKYLFWDGVNGEVNWDWSEGFSVHRDDVDTFLEQKTEQLGLNFAEAQDFITYWAPMIKHNEWSLVSFQTERYEELAKLLIDPKPETLIRVFMIFKKTDKKVDIEEQQLSTLERKGFTVVEWGGSNLDEK